MQVKQFIKKMYITILIDFSSTHKFLDPNVTKRTTCPILQTN